MNSYSAVASSQPPSRFTTKQFMTINDKRMAYVEVGEGDPIVFLHGNPTSSYLWRNVMPQLEGRGRLIAPDLIGMGDSDKLDRSGPNRYTYIEHSNYLFRLLEKLGVKKNVTLVLHDWGSALGFLWAYQHRFDSEAVKGIAFMESIVTTFDDPSIFPEEVFDLFEQIRGPQGEELVLQNNLFVEQLLPGSILRNLSSEEMDEYRRPFLNPGEDRRTTLTWPRQLPILGEPKDVVELVRKYSEWMKVAAFPKLFVDVLPGTQPQAYRELVREWPNLTSVSVRGLHYVQEDSPVEVGRAIATWLG